MSRIVKAIILLLSLIIGATAYAFPKKECPLILRDVVFKGLDQNKECVNCLPSLMDEVSNVTEPAVITVTWLSSFKFSARERRQIQEMADQSGVQLFSQLTEEVSYRHPSWRVPGAALILVFKGQKDQLQNFVQALPQLHLHVGYYKILKDSPKTTNITGAPEAAASDSLPEMPPSISSVSIQQSVFQRQKIFGPLGSLNFGDNHPVIIFTSRGQPKYVAFYPPWIKKAPINEVLKAYKEAVGLRRSDKIPPTIESLVHIYREAPEKVTPSQFSHHILSDVNIETFNQIFASEKPMIFYPASKDRNSEPLSFVLLPAAKTENEIVLRKGATPTAGTISTTEFITKRAALLGPDSSYELRASNPIVGLTANSELKLLVVHPLWLKTAPLADIARMYRSKSGLPDEVPLPSNFEKFVTFYRQVSTSQLFSDFETIPSSKINLRNGQNILDKIKDKPLLMTIEKGSGAKWIEYVLVPIEDSAQFLSDITRLKILLREKRPGTKNDMAILSRLDARIRDPHGLQEVREVLGENPQRLKLYQTRVLESNRTSPNYPILSLIVSRLREN